MKPKFGWSLDTSSFVEVSISSSMVLETSYPKVIWDVTKPYKTKFRFLTGLRNTHLNDGHQRFGCPSKFGKNWFSVELPIIWYLSELILLILFFQFFKN